MPCFVVGPGFGDAVLLFVVTCPVTLFVDCSAVEGSLVVFNGSVVTGCSVVILGPVVGGFAVTTGVGLTTAGIELELTTRTVLVLRMTKVGVEEITGVPEMTVVTFPGTAAVAVGVAAGVATGVIPGKICRLTLD